MDLPLALALSLLLNLGCFVALIISRAARHRLRRAVVSVLSTNEKLLSVNTDLRDVLKAYQGAWYSQACQDSTDEYLARNLRAQDIKDIEHGMGG